MKLVDQLGLLQPTVSMSVSSLVEEGLVTRFQDASSARTSSVSLTEKGEAAARELSERIESIIVRRKLRGSRKAADQD